MKFNPGILRPYDIRGEYGVDFDDEFARRLGAAVVAYKNAKQVIVARDMRPSSPVITQAVIDGITSAGADVIDIGEASTPFFYYTVINGPAPIGITITASHMGEEFNGFKICRNDAMTLGSMSGLSDIVPLIQQEPIPSSTRGTITKEDYRGKHTDFVIQQSGIKPGDISLRVAVEAAPMIDRELDTILRALKITRVDANYDIKFAFDADGDRLMVYDSVGKQIRADLFAGILALSLARGGAVIADLRASNGVTDYLKERGITLIPSKIGHTNIKQVMKEHEVIFAGETSGHVMFQSIKYSESTQLAVLMLLKIMTDEHKTIDELVAPMDTWSYSMEMNTPIEGWPDSVQPILEKVKQKYPDAKINEIDGLRVDYPDWWLLLRASGTEPVMRLIVEGKTKERMDEKIKEVQGFLK